MSDGNNYEIEAYATVNDNVEHIGFATKADADGARAVNIFEQFDGKVLTDLHFADDAPEEPAQQPEDEPTLEDNEMTFSVPLTRAEAKEQEL